MVRILLWPDELRRLSTTMEREGTELAALTGRAGSTLTRLGWRVSQQERVEQHYAEASRLGEQLAEQARAMARFLRESADRFDQADRAPVGGWQWPSLGREHGLPASLAPWAKVAPGAAIPVTSGGTGRWLTETYPELFNPPVAGQAPGQAPGQVPGQAQAPGLTEAEHVSAMLAQYFPKPADQMILRHTMAEEGPSRFGAAWGGVVYRPQNSTEWIADNQVLNFGIISFAFPSGSAGGVLRRILSSPEEEQAFREIASRHVQDHPGGSVSPGWQHLLRETQDPTIAPKSQAELIDEFVTQIKAGDDTQTADWMLKYASQEKVGSYGVATTKLDPAWDATMEEWLSRPASQVAQLSVAHDQYLKGALPIAEQLQLKTVRGVGFVFDAVVQGGSLPPAALAEANNADFQALPESEKLQRLLAHFGPGSTEWHRRKAVIDSPYLTDDPYPFKS